MTLEGIHFMTTFHAIAWVDHQGAQVLQFDAEHVQADKIKAHTHYTRQHGSAVRSEHEFFGQVCDAMAGITEVLVVGPHTAIADFRHYAEKHRAETAKHLVAYEPLAHLSENQLVAKAREFFLKHDRMAGTPTPT
jgi:stalled ribosome rescue protein Dom34